MLKHSLGRILAQLWRRKLYSFISILSLTVGLSVFSLIFLHVKWQLSYDRGWPDSGRIHRVLVDGPGPSAASVSEFMQAAWAEQLPVYLDEFIEAASQLRSLSATANLDEREVSFSIQLTDSHFVRIFRPELVAGDLQQTLMQPGLLALDEAVAEELFGSADLAMGKLINLSGGSGILYRDGQANRVQGESQEFQVAAVYRLPEPVSQATRFQALTMMGEHAWRLSPLPDSSSMVTWLKLKPGVATESVDQSLIAYVDAHFPVSPLIGPDMKTSDVYELSLEPLHELYFSGRTLVSRVQGGNLPRVITFSIIGLLVLLAGCTNTVSISLASILDRTREVGILKAIGAQRNQLTLQYMGESLLLTLLALIPTLILTQLLHPTFAQLLSLRELPELGVPEACMLAAIAIVLGLIMGLYPALVLARQKPVESLRGQTSKKQASLLNLRTLLVGAQFTCALLLLVGTLALYAQLVAARKQPLGFSHDNLLVVSSLPFVDLPADDVLANAMEAVPGVQDVVAPAVRPRNSDVLGNRGTLVHSTTETDGVEASRIAVIPEHFRLVEIPLIAGREFDEQRDGAAQQPVQVAPAVPPVPGQPIISPPQRAVLNRLAARSLGYSEAAAAVGERVYLRTEFGAMVAYQPLDVLGVVEDSMYFSLRSRPVAEFYMYSPGNAGARIQASLILRYDDSVEDSIADRIREAWGRATGTEPSSVTSLETQLNAVYGAEQREGTLLLICAGMALLLSTIGLYGLVSVAMKTQIKEIGVRKVLGASRARIVGIFLLRFIKPMLPANLIAWPVAVYFVLQWIERFPYQLDKSWLVPICLVGSALVLLVTCGTVAGLSARAAGAKPTMCLRYE